METIQGIKILEKLKQYIQEDNNNMKQILELVDNTYIKSLLEHRIKNNNTILIAIGIAIDG